MNEREVWSDACLDVYVCVCVCVCVYVFIHTHTQYMYIYAHTHTHTPTHTHTHPHTPTRYTHIHTEPVLNDLTSFTGLRQALRYAPKRDLLQCQKRPMAHASLLLPLPCIHNRTQATLLACVDTQTPLLK